MRSPDNKRQDSDCISNLDYYVYTGAFQFESDSSYLLLASILQCRMITLLRNFGSYIVKTRIFKTNSNKLL